jgi:hypothetical protein
LIAAVIDRSAETAVERMRNLIADSMNAESAFRQVGSLFIQTMQDGEIDNATRLELEIWVEGLKNNKLFEKSQKAWAMRMKWLEALVARGIEEGIYDAEAVEPRAMASLLIAIWLGLRMGRLMGDEFDLSGALRSFAMMHAGRLQPQMASLAMPK